MTRIVFLLSLFFCVQTYAHDYYFAFAEVSYNDMTEKFEATLSVSTHDLESAINSNSVLIKDITLVTDNSPEFLLIEQYLMKHFKVSTSNDVKFSLIGHETSMNGTSNFYFESKPAPISGHIDVHFDLLIDTYQEQQNKITFYYHGESYTRPFNYDIKEQYIKLEKTTK
ncbi:hypothetical protein N9963_02745 [Crocinitomicaceae bacterium]|mgnify:CR=1 FL=1|nr:hypothetical protein [Crocinitomicaceae bacterium]